MVSILGNGVRTHVNSKGKVPCTRGSEEDWTRDTALYRTASPTHYQLSYSGPRSEPERQERSYKVSHIHKRERCRTWRKSDIEGICLWSTPKQEHQQQTVVVGLMATLPHTLTLNVLNHTTPHHTTQIYSPQLYNTHRMKRFSRHTLKGVKNLFSHSVHRESYKFSYFSVQLWQDWSFNRKLSTGR